jgi:hypothetical protein
MRRAFVVTEDHVHHPVNAVLDGPMAADDGTNLVSEPRQRGEVEARFSLDLVGDFAGALDHAVQLFCVARCIPRDIDHGGA